MILVGNGALLERAARFALESGCKIDRVVSSTAALAAFCAQHRLDFLATPRVNDEARAIRGSCSDGLVLSINNDQILRAPLLGSPGLRFFNVHGGITARYRGRPDVCVVFALLHGETEYGATLHEIDASIDGGDVVDVERFTIGARDDFQTVMLRTIEACDVVLRRNLTQLVADTQSKVPLVRDAARPYASKDLARLSALTENPNFARASRLGIFRPSFSDTWEALHRVQDRAATAPVDEEVVTVEAEDATLFGILCRPPGATRLLVLVPTLTGTRIGPQRLFVRIARSLARRGVATLRADLSITGDGLSRASCRWRDRTLQETEALYLRDLDAIVECMQARGPFDEIVTCSISQACLPVLVHAKGRGLRRVILLSPNHFPPRRAALQTGNLRRYYHKLFMRETWRKAWRGKLQLGAIRRNLFAGRGTDAGGRSPAASSGVPESLVVAPELRASSNVGVLCVYGGRDEALTACRAFWNALAEVGACGRLREDVVEDADHSFFGWNHQEAVAEAVGRWLIRDA